MAGHRTGSGHSHPASSAEAAQQWLFEASSSRPVHEILLCEDTRGFRQNWDGHVSQRSGREDDVDQDSGASVASGVCQECALGWAAR